MEIYTVNNNTFESFDLAIMRRHESDVKQTIQKKDCIQGGLVFESYDFESMTFIDESGHKYVFNVEIHQHCAEFEEGYLRWPAHETHGTILFLGRDVTKMNYSADTLQEIEDAAEGLIDERKERLEH